MRSGELEGMILAGNREDIRREKRLQLGLLAAAFSILLLLSVGVGGCGVVGVAERAISPRIGFRAPDFTVKTLSGKESRLEDELGTPVFVNFFATRCPFCRVEMPYIQALYEELGDKVTFMIIDLQESKDTVESYFQAAGWTVPVYLDATAAVGKRFNVRGIPVSFFIDSDGIIRDMFIGAMTEKRLRQGIESILP